MKTEFHRITRLPSYVFAEVNKLKSISPVIFEIIRSPETVLSLSFDGSPSAKLVAPSIVNLASTKAKLANDNELPVIIDSDFNMQDFLTSAKYNWKNISLDPFQVIWLGSLMK